MPKAHSKFSASGAERWFNCPGSVKLSEGMPDKSSVWAEEGTKAHEVLEWCLKPDGDRPKNVPKEMYDIVLQSAKFIEQLYFKYPDAEFLVETRIHLEFIHPEMFGTFDAAVIEHFGTLHIFDFKYGAGHAVSPIDNLQMIFYALGMAYKYNWNFKKARLWIIQPRIKGYDGPTFYDVSMQALKLEWMKIFKYEVKEVLNNPDQVVEGEWCHWCKAKSVCPLKREIKLEKAKNIFDKKPQITKSDFY